MHSHHEFKIGHMLYMSKFRSFIDTDRSILLSHRMPGFPAPVESSPEHDIDSDDDVGDGPIFGMVRVTKLYRLNFRRGTQSIWNRLCQITRA